MAFLNGKISPQGCYVLSVTSPRSSQAMRVQTEMELRMFKQNEYVYHSMRDAALKNKPMTMMHEPKGVEDGIKNLFHRRK